MTRRKELQILRFLVLLNGKFYVYTVHLAKQARRAQAELRALLLL